MIPFRTVAIIQARVNSSRLPDKVLLDIAGQPMLVRVLERTKRARSIHQVGVATTTDPSDNPIAELCAERGYLCYRGSHQDVLDRYYQAARAFHAEIIVRITADCPVIDPDLIDLTVNSFLGIDNDTTGSNYPASMDEIPYDFAANRLPPPWGRTYPIGLDTEVCTFQSLETIWKEANQQHQREHVMPFFYEKPERFRLLHLNYESDYGAMRWTVDTAEDLEVIRKIYAHFLTDRPLGDDMFSWLDILDLFKRKPELAQINAQVQHKHYKQVDDRG